jgi:hypothetical protein
LNTSARAAAAVMEVKDKVSSDRQVNDFGVMAKSPTSL